MKSERRSFAFTVPAALAVLAWGVAGCQPAQTLGSQTSDYDMSFSVAEVMDAIVMPEADIVWNAVGFVSTPEGSRAIGPESEEDWVNLRRGVLALAESANTLAIPGRPANTPDAVANPGELTPAEIDERIAANRAAWIGFTRALRASAMLALEAVDSRDPDRILDVGGDIDLACEGCHQVFWYPEQ